MILQGPSWLQGGILIPGDTIDRLEQAVLSAYPGEACGILLGDRETKTIRAIRPAGNLADAEISGRFFRIDPLEVYRIERQAEDEGYEVAGFYHSHVEAEAVPSEEDGLYMIPGMICLILPVYGRLMGRVRAYRKDNTDGPLTEIVVSLKGRE